MPTVRIVGPGRAGASMAGALAMAGWTVAESITRGEDVTGAARGVDLCVLGVPDAAITGVAAAIEPVPATLVVHLAGAYGADVLVPHDRRAALHPLATLPDAANGARTLVAGVWWAVDGDPGAAMVVSALNGRLIAVAPAARSAYHAAACIAANHVITLLAQMERVAAAAGVPADALYDLAAAAVANARARGAAAALTGPAARGDAATLARHLDALDPGERDLYRALSAAAASLAARDRGLPAAAARVVPSLEVVSCG